uniref:Plac8 onzin related protein 2 n=1 Tax=Pygocentrus nattereri TaxID=42514 RepID=A0A3B4DT33_PYGNA
ASGIPVSRQPKERQVEPNRFYYFVQILCVCISTGCLGFWCPYCLMCNTSERFGECFCLPLVETCFGALVPPLTFAMRSSMRERYRIQGTMCDDCCVSTCCSLCVWCQIARELKHRQQPQVIHFIRNTILIILGRASLCSQ